MFGYQHSKRKMASEEKPALGIDVKSLSTLRVVDLKAELDKRGLSKSGSKKDLVDRLKVQIQLEKLHQEAAASSAEGKVPNLGLQDDAVAGQNEFVKQYLAEQQKVFKLQTEARKSIETEDSSSQEIESQSEDDSSHVLTRNRRNIPLEQVDDSKTTPDCRRRSPRKSRNVSASKEIAGKINEESEPKKEEDKKKILTEHEEDKKEVQIKNDEVGKSKSLKSSEVGLKKLDETSSETIEDQDQVVELSGSGKFEAAVSEKGGLDIEIEKHRSGETDKNFVEQGVVGDKVDDKNLKLKELESDSVFETKDQPKRRWDGKNKSENKQDSLPQVKDNKIKLKRRTSNQGSKQMGEQQNDVSDDAAKETVSVDPECHEIIKNESDEKPVVESKKDVEKKVEVPSDESSQVSCETSSKKDDENSKIEDESKETENKSQSLHETEKICTEDNATSQQKKKSDTGNDSSDNSDDSKESKSSENSSAGSRSRSNSGSSSNSSSSSSSSSSNEQSVKDVEKIENSNDSQVLLKDGSVNIEASVSDIKQDTQKEGPTEENIESELKTENSMDKPDESINDSSNQLHEKSTIEKGDESKQPDADEIVLQATENLSGNSVNIKDKKSESSRRISKSDNNRSEASSQKVESSSGQRKRRWGSSTVSKTSKRSSITISTESLKEILPDIKPAPVQKIPEVIEEKIEKPESKQHSSAPKVSRTVSQISNEDNEKDSVSNAPKNPVSCVLLITNLVRPFTVNQLKDLLSKEGKISDVNGFWIDKIKSKCLVKFDEVDVAFKTRESLDNISWPSSNPKKLIVDYSTEENINSHLDQTVSVQKPGKENEQKFPEKRKVSDERSAPVREWDRHKITQSPEEESKSKRSRYSSGSEKKDNSEKSKGPHAKLLDDLFRKTEATPCIYWLPLTDDQIKERIEEKKQRELEREKRRQQREMERNKARTLEQTRSSNGRRQRSRSRSPIGRRR